MFYRLLKHLVGICFNLLNFVLGGNLPPLGCVCMVVEEQGRFLLIRRPEGKLSFPSGFIRWRELPIQAAKRECLEETGLKLQIEPQDLICCYAHVGQHIDTMSTLTLVYTGKIVGGTLRGSIEGEACWLDEENMRCNLEKRCENLLSDYMQFRAKRVDVPGTDVMARYEKSARPCHSERSEESAGDLGDEQVTRDSSLRSE